MSRNEKVQFIRLIEGSDLSISAALAKYNIPPSTYYRWKQKLKTMGTKGLEDNKPHRARTWNQLLPQQVDKVPARFWPGSCEQRRTLVHSVMW